MDGLVFSIGNESKPILVSLNNLEGTKLVDIRKYYTEKNTGELSPTKKGISLNHRQFESLALVFSDNIKTFLDFFGTHSQELNKYELILEKHLIGRKFDLEHLNGKQTIYIDKNFAANFDENTLLLLKKMIQIVYTSITEVLDDNSEIETFLDYFSNKLNLMLK